MVFNFTGGSSSHSSDIPIIDQNVPAGQVQETSGSNPPIMLLAKSGIVLTTNDAGGVLPRPTLAVPSAINDPVTVEIPKRKAIHPISIPTPVQKGMQYVF